MSHRGGSRYTLTFTLSDTFADGGATALFQLSSDWVIKEQHGTYVGLTIVDGSIDGDYASRKNSDDGRAGWDSSTIIDTDTTLATGTNVDKYEGWFYQGADGTALRGATFTIASADNNTTITLQTADQTITLQRNAFYNPNDDNVCEFRGTANKIFKSASVEFDNNVIYSIPEPATATLSLLALAGLCARRRRG